MVSRIEHFRSDVMAGLVVFLVALPLCLGIALASGAPLFAGVISGIVGGVLIGSLSSSQISVAGPAAGLTAIVLAAIHDLGSFQVFLLAVALAGVIQFLMGVFKAGGFSSYLPTNVIEGMLAAIGVIIIMKQLPHAVGYKRGEGVDFSFFEPQLGHNSIEFLEGAWQTIDPGAMVLCAAALSVLIAWERIEVLRRIKAVPGALVAVAAGVALNEAFKSSGSPLAVSEPLLVSMPVPASFGEFFKQFTTPEFGAIKDPRVWSAAATIAAVASVETLLCIEAADKMDPMKRLTDTNRELMAQGAGNLVCGLIGGLPVTSVIVRTTANVSAGARTTTATIAHGLFLLAAVLFIPAMLNKIPLASLAAVLLSVGYKLAKPAVFTRMWEDGKYQFIPFIVTVAAVVFIDLLKGVAIGLAVSVFLILRANMKIAYSFKKEEYDEGEVIKIELAQEVSFLNKAAIKAVLSQLPENSRVVIDAARSFYVDHDVLALIRDFIATGAKERGIKARFVGYKHTEALERKTLVTSS
jgi:MFS superfamily sulfate permease-like transporter